MNVPLKVNIKRIQDDIETLAKFVDQHERGFTRLSFSREYQRATDFIADKMVREAGLVVKKDVIGNLIGRQPGRVDNAPCLMIGSHLDTVKAGGRFDGIVGVVAGLEIARCLFENDIKLHHALEVVAFLAEEPSPFGKSTVGSRAMTGNLTLDSLKNATDLQGKTLYQAIKEFGGDPDRLNEAIRNPGSIAAYWELHIEQGPVLDQQQIPIGVVTGIVSIVRAELEINGVSNHAGTTPMSLRKDALTAAADIVTAIDRIARGFKNMVATIGEFNIEPNFSNVIPGRVKMGMELRSIEEKDLVNALDKITKRINKCAGTFGIEISFKHWLSSPKVNFPNEMAESAQQTCDKLGLSYLSFPSGAGHDASYLAEIARAGMIFIPSKNGLSHCPEEYSSWEDIFKGVDVLAGVILKLDDTLLL